MFNTERKETNSAGVTSVYSGESRHANYVMSKRGPGWFFPESLISTANVFEIPADELELDEDKLFEAVSEGLAKVALESEVALNQESNT